MNITTEPTIIYVVRLTEQELADALVDPASLQDQLRAARASRRADADTRTDNIAYSRRAPYRVDGKQIARAAKKQNKKIAKRFLAKAGAGLFRCEQCPKTFDTQKSLNIHFGKAHNGKTHYAPRAKASLPTTDLLRHGNTFPVSAGDAASDLP